MTRSNYVFKLLVLLCAGLLTLAACGEEAPDTEPAGGGGQTEGPQFETIEEGTLLVGSCLDYPPFESVKGGEPTGFDVEMSQEIGKRLDLTVEFKKADFDTIFTAVAAGRFDMVAAASTITEERLQTVDFSDPYFNSRQSLTVNTEETPDIASIDDLGEGDVVGVQKGTTGKEFAEKELAPNGVQIRTFQNAPDAFTDLEAGNLVGVVNDEGASIGIIENRPGLEVVQAIDTDEEYGFAFSKDNPELTEAVNGVLAEIIADGTYEDLFKKYFPDNPVPEEFRAQ
jgi:polar amino acid transport system substrate-binding protein